MTFLLIKYNKKLDVVSPETYGMDTWGSWSHQESIEKKKKYWYTRYWSPGGEWLEDTVVERKLNVVVETTDIQDILRYVYEKYDEQIPIIIEQIREIVNDYLDFIKHFN